MNIPEVLMGVAAGIGILAAVTHSFVGFARRPVDRTRLAFAAASLAAAVAALASPPSTPSATWTPTWRS